MWKRLPLRDRGVRNRENLQIGAPELLESTYDPDQLDRAQDLSPTSEQHYGYHNPDIRPSRARQDVENDLKLPSLNFSKPPSTQKPLTSLRPHNSVAGSSVYSQADRDVSPPSSPGRRPLADDGEVSPIEEHPPHGMNNILKPSQRRESNIPVPRKVTPTSARGPPQNVPRTKEWTHRVGQGELKWDPMYGEPVVDGGVKGSSVKPGEFDFRADLRPTRKLQGTLTSNEKEPQKEGFRERASRFAQKGLAVDTRPPWKGASGRHAIPEAPKDAPGQAFPQPRREVGRVRSPQITPTSAGPFLMARDVAHPSETRHVAASPPLQNFQEQNTRQIMPDQNASTRQIYESPVTSTQYRPDAYLSPVSFTDDNVTPTREHPHFSTATTLYLGDQITLPKNKLRDYTDEEHPAHRTKGDFDTQKADGSVEDPSSRFSWTTTATSTYQHSPPPSPPPPMPAPYANIYAPAPLAIASRNRSPTEAPSILDRGHPTRHMSPAPSTPMSGRSFSASSTLRKPVASPPAVQPPSPPEVIHQAFPMGDWRTGTTTKFHKQRSVSLAPSTLTTSSQSKLLPKTPQELSSADLITTLQAQQSDLATQRANIQRLIADLEKPEAKNPLVCSFKMIRENEKKLVGLREELDEVGRAEYEAGMRLHRAWKRREREDPNTPASVFWVRRATAGE